MKQYVKHIFARYTNKSRYYQPPLNFISFTIALSSLVNFESPVYSHKALCEILYSKKIKTLGKNYIKG